MLLLHFEKDSSGFLLMKLFGISAAIPPSKGVQHGNLPPKEDSPTQDSGGIIGWMKGAVSSGGLLSKMAEKAKSSVDSMITTLDPQMREFMRKCIRNYNVLVLFHCDFIRAELKYFHDVVVQLMTLKKCKQCIYPIQHLLV